MDKIILLSPLRRCTVPKHDKIPFAALLQLDQRITEIIEVDMYSEHLAERFDVSGSEIVIHGVVRTGLFDLPALRFDRSFPFQ